jgi:hypothetical protein
MAEQNQGKSSEEVVNLLLEQKYQEAIPILDALIEEYPSHEEYSVYRSLVLRILIAHWTLSRVSSGNTRSGGAHRLRRSFVGVFQFAKQKLMRSLKEIYKSLYQKQTVRIAVLSCAILVMLVGIQEGNNVKNPKPPQTSINRDNAQSTLLSAETVGRPLTISTREIADNDNQLNPLRTESDETPSAPATAKEADDVTISATQLKAIPNNQPQNSTASKSKTAKAHIAKAPDRNGASNKQQPATVVSRNNDSALAPSEKADNNNDAILDDYRSARPIGLRKSPSFAAEAIGEIHTGESLGVREFTGSWAKVRLKPSGAVGFVRRELLVPITKNDGTPKGQTDESTNTATPPAP